MTISLTEKAAAHVQKVLAQTPGAIGLRVGVTKSGCSGFAYKLDFANDVAEGDRRFESHGVTLIVADENLAYLEGTVLDYRREGLSEGFKFENPNVKGQCGCGESFTV
jgi:iron-sulfur cluster assembly protein